MKLKVLKSLIDKAAGQAGDSDPDVEVYHGDTLYEIVRVGQFNIVPDVVITVVKPTRKGKRNAV